MVVIALETDERRLPDIPDERVESFTFDTRVASFVFSPLAIRAGNREHDVRGLNINLTLEAPAFSWQVFFSTPIAFSSLEGWKILTCWTSFSRRM